MHLSFHVSSFERRFRALAPHRTTVQSVVAVTPKKSISSERGWKDPDDFVLISRAPLLPISCRGQLAVFAFFTSRVRFMHMAKLGLLRRFAKFRMMRKQKELGSRSCHLVWHSRCSVRWFAKGESFAYSQRAKCMVRSRFVRKDSRGALSGGVDPGGVGAGQFIDFLTSICFIGN